MTLCLPYVLIDSESLVKIFELTRTQKFKDPHISGQVWLLNPSVPLYTSLHTTWLIVVVTW